MPPETPPNPDVPMLRHEEDRQLAEAVRAACLEAALRGYADARMSGLCHEGAWEAAVGAVRMLDVEQVLTGTARPIANRP